jgi:N-acetylneuraminic acid mutarotase
LPTARSELGSATFEHGGQIYVVGGSVMGVKPSVDVWRYDPTANHWYAETPIPSARKGTVAAVIGDKIVVTTGSSEGVTPAAETWIGCCLD